MNKWAIASLILLTVSALFACGTESVQDPQYTGITDSTITIGSWGPLSGPAALWGAVPHAMDAYFHWINEQGGVHGRKIQFVYRDDAYNPAKTVPAVRQLIEQDQVFALIGGLGTTNGLAVMDYILEKEVPWVSPGSGSSQWSTPLKPTIFSTFVRYEDEAQIQVRYVLDSLDTHSIAIVYQNDDFGNSALKGVEAALAERSIDLVAKVSYEISERDLSTQAHVLQASGAKTVLLWTAPRQAVALLAACRSLAYRPQWVASSVLSDMQQLYQLTNGDWAGVIFGYYGLMPTDSVHPRLQQYKNALQQYHPEVAWGAFAETGFIYAEPLIEGLLLTGRKLNRSRFLAGMEAIDNFQGIGPVFSFGDDNHQGHHSIYLVRCLTEKSYTQLTSFWEASRTFSSQNE